MKKDDRLTKLTSYQHRVFREYERILEITGLNPSRIFDFVNDDPSAIVPTLKLMIDQTVRSHVILEYTMIDMELDHIISEHFFGSGKKHNSARKSKRYKTLALMLQNAYLMQKLTIIKNFKSIPKNISGKIGAINDLRNGLAHTFFISELSPSKRTYRGHSIFTRRGLEAFSEDVRVIQDFLVPWLSKIVDEYNGDL